MKLKGHLFLFCITIVALWQIVFLQNGMKWDFVDAFLPSRYFFSESVLNNSFPFWNPYILYGIPIYSDLVSVFNPEFWIIGNLIGYSNISLQYMFVMYVVLSGLTFRYFLKNFQININLNYSLSIAYMLSGIIIGNAQNLALILGYALLPLVITSYIKLLNSIKIESLLKFCITLFLMIYSSYPALTIITAYFLLFIFAVHIIKSFGNKKVLFKLLKFHFVIVIITVIFSSVLLVSYFQASPYLSQYDGTSLYKALQHPFSIQSSLSFLLPMTTGNAANVFETDVSMANGYFGLFSLVFFIFILSSRQIKKQSVIFLIFGIFSLISAFGEDFFLRTFLFEYVPFMDLFRYPSIFRVFSIFSFLAFIAINFQDFTFNRITKKKLLIISVSISITLIAIFFYSISKIDQFIYFDTDLSFVDKVLNANIFENIILQAFIQIILLVSFIIVILRCKSTKFFFTSALILFLIDGVISTQLNINYTVIGKTDPIEFSNYLKSVPKGFPTPELNPFEEHSDKNATTKFTWQNNNVFPKKVSYDGLISFKLDGLETLTEEHPSLFDSILKMPFIYLSDDIRPSDSIKNFDRNTLFFNKHDFNIFKETYLEESSNDSLYISNFNPNKIQIRSNTHNAQILTLQQNFHENWKVCIDGDETDIYVSNFTQMSILLPKGQHNVTFTFSNNIIFFWFGLSYLCFFTLLFLSVYFYLKKYPERRKTVITIAITLLTVFIITVLIKRLTYNAQKESSSIKYKDKLIEWKKEYLNDIFIISDDKLYNQVKNENIDEFVKINNLSLFSEINHILTNSNYEKFAFAWKNSKLEKEALELIYSYYPEIIFKKLTPNSGILLLEKGKVKEYLHLQDFENNDTNNWKVNDTKILTDSTTLNRYFQFQENDEWGPSIEIKYNSELRDLKSIVFYSDILIEKSKKDIPLVFSINNGLENKIWRSYPINKFCKNKNEWFRTCNVIDLDESFNKNDVIKIYFWNNNNSRFRIDNLKIKYIF